MKKIVKTILIIISLLVGIILFDTLQARILKNSPLISFKQKLGGDNYVNRGLLIDTYYCVKEKDIVTISWEFKTSKFDCPVYSIDEEMSERKKSLVNLIKEKYIEFGYMDEDNIETFEVGRILERGYFASTPDVRYFQVEFNYSCKNGDSDCIKIKKPKYDESDYETVFIVMDKDEIIEFRSWMIATTIDSDFIQEAEEIK